MNINTPVPSQADSNATPMKIVKVGRAPENDLVLADEKVSAFHASFTQNEAGICFVQDLKSSNGTWVNGHKIAQQPYQLAPADVVRLGSTCVEWQTYFEQMNSGDLASAQTKNAHSFPEREVRPEVSYEDQKLESRTVGSRTLWEEIMQTRKLRDADYLLKNRILTIGLVIIALLFLFLLAVWYINYMVRPSLSSYTNQSLFIWASIWRV